MNMNMNKEALDFISSNFGNFALLIIVIAVSIVAVKIGITFDINKYLEQRKKTHLSKAQNLCPHLEFDILDQDNNNRQINVQYRSLFESPSGTTKWICSRCGSVRNNVDENQIAQQAQHYLSNTDLYQKTMKRYNKHMKKAL